MRSVLRSRRLAAAVLCAAGVVGGLFAEAADLPAARAVPRGGDAVASPTPRAGMSVSTASRAYAPLVLKGKLKRTIPWAKLPVSVTWDGTKAGNINPGLRAKYRGQTLYKLIGLVDDKDPKTFNVAKARKRYGIQFVCSDGYKRTIDSSRIIGRKTYIIARLKNGAPLPDGEGPYRYVGGFIKPFNGKDSARMIVQIRLVF